MVEFFILTASDQALFAYAPQKGCSAYMGLHTLRLIKSLFSVCILNIGLDCELR